MVGLSWVGGCKTAVLLRRGCALQAALWVQCRELRASLMEKREAARLSAFCFQKGFHRLLSVNDSDVPHAICVKLDVQD